MELKHKQVCALVLFGFITTIFCSAKFRISKWNMCPPEESKFLSLVKISLDVCVDECFRRKHCFAVGYKRLYTLCELYTEFTPVSTYRGHCAIVNKDDIQSPDESINADQGNECAECQAPQPTGIGSTCSKQECQRQEILENEVRQGNMNEIGSKMIVSCKQNENDVVDVQKPLVCSSSGEWEISSTVESLNTGQYWVDGYNERNKVDEWKFSDDTLVPMGKHFWKCHAPNEQEGDPFCMRMVRHKRDEIGDHRFDDTECSNTFGYICEQN